MANEKESGANSSGELVRINRALSLAGFGSRRAAEALVEAGRVSVNGETVTDLGRRVDLSRDKLAVDGKTAEVKSLAYYAFYKPRGVVTTMSDEKGRESVFDWIKKLGVKEPVKPAGRLDRRSEGLLLLTNDGALTQKLTHPSSEVLKVYRISIDKAITAADVKDYQQGIELEDGPAKLVSIKLVRPQEKTIVYEVGIQEGRNRIIRRMLGARGYKVKRLVRIAHGSLSIKGLKSGEIRPLSKAEVAALKRM